MPPKSEIRIDIPRYVPLIIAGGLVLAAAVGSWTFYAVRTLDNVISVTGSAKTHVTSDTVKWTVTVSRTVYESGLQAGYAGIAHDTTAVQEFLKSHSITNGVTVSPAVANEIYQYNGSSGPRQFTITQSIVVQSKDVKGIDALSKNVAPLTGQGIFLSGNYLEFYVSNLPELRVSLLGAAIKDAKARATEIAKAGGQSVGRLKSASSGVVQVLAPNSVDISDYGQYDTQSMEKDVMVSVRATFSTR